MNDVVGPKEKQVTLWINKLEDEIIRADSLSLNILDLVKPIMPEFPKDACENEKLSPQLVPLAEQIRSLTKKLSEVSDRYEGILSLNEL